MSGRAPQAGWGPVYTLGLILLVTVAWWAFALWPSSADSAAWLDRARAVCFNLTETGLPDVSGWMLLVGQPLGMVALLAVGWGGGLATGLRRLSRLRSGRGVMVLSAVVVAGGLGAAGVRVATAQAAVAPVELPALADGAAPRRLDRPAPTGLLTDQHGHPVGVATFAGRPLLVTFAFGNCATVCPLVVHEAVASLERLEREGIRAGLLVVSLDPWRDTPARLPSMAERWALPDGAHVVSGEVADVEGALDGWGVPRTRDLRTGDIVHPALTYVVDPAGTIAFATTGRSDVLVPLVMGIPAAP
ncbi:MAG: SCO family protein [Longimicrobiales bacterium]